MLYSETGEIRIKFGNKKIYLTQSLICFRYKDAERLHTAHYNFALSRGDIHGLAISCGNIGFLKFYNPEEFDDSVVFQFIGYSLAEEVGDFARTGIAFNKIGKLYTTLGYNEEAVEVIQIALDRARRASNVAREGMAWGDLGTVYRALKRFEDAIECHIKYRDNAERRMDIGGVAIMQHQLAMDYFLSENVPEAERSILDAFQTLEKIRSQIGEEDKSKLSNFEKNQAEAYNLLQVVLVAQMKYKESLVLADSIRGRALADIVKKRLCGYNNSSGTEATTLNEEFIAESFNNLLEVSRKLSTTLVFYSVVKEFDESGAFYTWVYAWVLHPSGRLNFNKSRLQHGIRETKVELNGEFVVSLRRSMGQPSHVEDLGKILRCEKHLSVSAREAKAHIATLESEDVLNSLKVLQPMFVSGLDESKTENETNLIHSSLNIPYKTKEKAFYDRPNFQSDTFYLDNMYTHSKAETHSKEQHGERESDPELEPWIPMLSQLHKVLIEPIVEFLPDKDENPRVTFIPQDFLLKVPFAALQGEARDHYIMEDFVISTSPAIHFLELACASRETAEQATAPLELSLLAVGNPIMPFEELPQLPSAQREVRMINEIINSPKSEVLIGSRAKKKDVMTAMPKHKILHFATHAIVDDADSHGDFSMKGFIVLTKSGLECNGILTAEEVRGMELKAELVVLSCCDTGLGKVTGDGVLGELFYV